jgi:hypothetical protein
VPEDELDDIAKSELSLSQSTPILDALQYPYPYPLGVTTPFSSTAD